MKYPPYTDLSRIINTLATFVHLSGDTMTGALSAPALSAGAVTAGVFYGTPGVNSATYFGGAGGYIDLRGGDADENNDQTGGPAGHINLRGSMSEEGTAPGGSIDLSAGSGASGGNITSTGGGDGSPGGSLNMSGGDGSGGGHGGSINTSGGSGGDVSPGGDINTSGNGGSINTSGNGGFGGSIISTGVLADGDMQNGGTLNMSANNFEDSGSNGGSINTQGGHGFDGGSINTSGGAEGTGGSIDTSNGGGYISTNGVWNDGDEYGKSGGSINTSGGEGGTGGSINTSGGEDDNGGSIDTSNGGGSINTREGYIQLGLDSAGGQRTTIQGTAAGGNKTIYLPNDTGTLLLSSPYIVYNNQDTTFGQNVTINGNLTALGTSTFKNTIFTTTSALSVVNTGPGPALYVFQAAGPYDVASFYDGDGVEVLHVGNANVNEGGKVGINESYPGAELTVNGAISSNGSISVASMQVSNNVGIGAYAPNYFNLDVNGSAGDGSIGNSYGNLSLGASSDIAINPNNNLLLGPAGNVGIGTTTPAEKLTIAGNIKATGLIYSRSVLPQLPAPKIVLGRHGSIYNTTIQYLTGGYDGHSPEGRNVNYGIASDLLYIFNHPQLIVKDITEEMLSTYQIFIEMVILKKRKNKPVSAPQTQGTSFKVPVGNDGDKPWTGVFWTRSGGIGNAFADGGLIRYNQLPVSYNRQTIDLTPCLNGHFAAKPVAYRDQTSVDPFDFKYLNCIVPFGGRGTGSSNPVGSQYRFGYSSRYQPLYIAFRYIAWLPENNNGRGQIVDGPLSPTIRVTNTLFPFFPNSYESSAKGFSVVDVNPGFANDQKKQFRCKF